MHLDNSVTLTYKLAANKKSSFANVHPKFVFSKFSVVKSTDKFSFCTFTKDWHLASFSKHTGQHKKCEFERKKENFVDF